MACVINGSVITSPIPSQEIEKKLLPLETYTRPSGSDVTDVRVGDHKARSLRVAVWLHRLDMSLSRVDDASRCLIPSRHTQGHLLNHFLAPGTCNITYEDVLAQVIEENHGELQRMHKHLISLLQNHHSWRTRYLDELARLSRQLDSTGSGQFRDGGKDDTHSGFKVSPGLTRSSRVQLPGQSGQFIQISGSPAPAYKREKSPIKDIISLFTHSGGH